MFGEPSSPPPSSEFHKKKPWISHSSQTEYRWLFKTEYWTSGKCDLKWQVYIWENKRGFLWQVFSWQLYEATQKCGVFEVVPTEMDYWKNASEVGKAAW